MESTYIFFFNIIDTKFINFTLELIMVQIEMLRFRTVEIVMNHKL